MEKTKNKVIQKSSDILTLAAFTATVYVAAKGWKMLFKDIWDLIPNMEDIQDEK